MSVDFGSSSDESCSPPSTSSVGSFTENESSHAVTQLNVLSTSFKLSTVILNGVNLPLQTIQKVITSFPSLKEIHLAENNFDPSEICSIHSESSDLVFSSSVRVLNLNACGFTEWKTVLRFLKLFPNTKYLYLAENKLESIDNEIEDLNTEQVSLSYLFYG